MEVLNELGMKTKKKMKQKLETFAVAFKSLDRRT